MGAESTEVEKVAEVRGKQVVVVSDKRVGGNVGAGGLAQAAQRAVQAEDTDIPAWNTCPMSPGCPPSCTLTVFVTVKSMTSGRRQEVRPPNAHPT